MKRAMRILPPALLAGLLLSMTAVGAEKGFKSIFDGKTLKGWDGDPKFWSVKDGAITGQTTKENPTKGNTFIIWTGGKTTNFELKLQYRIVKGNSGIQYRSFKLPKGADRWRIGGYQADFEAGKTYSGILYGERFRGILCRRGQKTEIVRKGNRHQVKVVGKVGDSAAIQKKIKHEDWNDYHIIAKGFHFVHKINGVTTADCTDNDKKMRRKTGLLALQLHQGPPMVVQFRNIRIKHLPKFLISDPTTDGTKKKEGAFRLRLPKVRVALDRQGITVKGKRFAVGVGKRSGTPANVQVRTLVNGKSVIVKGDVGPGKRTVGVAVDPRTGRVTVALNKAESETKKIVLIAGRKSHGYGAHEHKAGCMLLAKALNESGLPVKASVVTEGWPKDESVLDDADAIVIYADGGGRHPFNRHIEKIDKLMKKGVGLVCIHYGVEVPKGKSGNAFLDWTGGYFETHWSVNPHWTAKYKKFPKHEITRGVKPFSIRDEWYYHMRFRPKMRGVTPILTDLPPASTLVKPNGQLARPDNAHNNNKHVREAVLKRKEPQHVAWATQRKDGGRGFGFTGGHNHWNWGHNQFRKLVLNAIVWTAKVEVPKEGVKSKPLTVKDLMANQDYKPRGNFNPARIQKMLDDWNAATESK